MMCRVLCFMFHCFLFLFQILVFVHTLFQAVSWCLIGVIHLFKASLQGFSSSDWCLFQVSRSCWSLIGLESHSVFFNHQFAGSFVSIANLILIVSFHTSINVSLHAWLCALMFSSSLPARHVFTEYLQVECRVYWIFQLWIMNLAARFLRTVVFSVHRFNFGIYFTRNVKKQLQRPCLLSGEWTFYIN